MDIFISNADGRPIYEQIVRQIKEQILSGKLQEGEMLPSMRLLARDLRIGVITTKRAYVELEREGFLVIMAGRGCVVAWKNLELVREEQLRRAEDGLQKAVDAARIGNISLEELTEMLRTLYREI